MKKLITLLITFTVLSAAIAQSTDEQKKRIANIKKSNDYIYAEVTTTGQQQAIDLATELLYSNINEWVAKKKKFAGSGKIVTKNRNYSVENVQGIHVCKEIGYHTSRQCNGDGSK